MNRYQVVGMARYELLMQWRRSILRLFLVLLALFMLAAGVPHLPDNPDARTLTSAIIASIWGPLVFLLMFLLPILVAEVIPIDRQVGMRELLDSLPMQRSVYLTGKLLGTWSGLIAAMVLMMVVGVGVAWLKSGGIILSAYIEMWIVGGFSLALINSGLSVLLSVGQRTRRTAIISAVGFLIVLFLLRDLHGSPFWDAVNPLRLPLLNYYLNLYSDQPHNMIIAFTEFSPMSVLLTIAAGFVQVFLVWLGAAAWLQWQDNKG